MKRKIVLFLVLFCSFFIMIDFDNIKADSGWDFNYDSGDSGWSGNSDYDSGGFGWSGDFDYGSDFSGNLSLKEILIFLSIIYIIIITSVIKEHRKAKKQLEIPNVTLSVEDIAKLGMTTDEFKIMTFNLYKELQNAWTEFDYNKLRKLTTDEIANSYIMQLDALKLKNQKNIMSDISFSEARIKSIKEENGILNVDVFLSVKMYDYVIDDNNRIVRGDRNKKYQVLYDITLVRESDVQKPIKCPGCGAELDIITTGICPYCRNKITVNAQKFVMSKKTCIDQRRIK